MRVFALAALLTLIVGPSRGAAEQGTERVQCDHASHGKRGWRLILPGGRGGCLEAARHQQANPKHAPYVIRVDCADETRRHCVEGYDTPEMPKCATAPSWFTTNIGVMFALGYVPGPIELSAFAWYPHGRGGWPDPVQTETLLQQIMNGERPAGDFRPYLPEAR